MTSRQRRYVVAELRHLASVKEAQAERLVQVPRMAAQRRNESAAMTAAADELESTAPRRKPAPILTPTDHA